MDELNLGDAEPGPRARRDEGAPGAGVRTHRRDRRRAAAGRALRAGGAGGRLRLRRRPDRARPSDREAGRRAARGGSWCACSTTSRRCCARAGHGLDDVVKTTVYLVDLGEMAARERGLRARTSRRRIRRERRCRWRRCRRGRGWRSRRSRCGGGRRGLRREGWAFDEASLAGSPVPRLPRRRRVAEWARSLYRHRAVGVDHTFARVRELAEPGAVGAHREELVAEDATRSAPHDASKTMVSVAGSWRPKLSWH